MKLIEDLGTRIVGNKNRKKRFGIYECPKCFKHFEVVTESVNSGASTQCRECYYLSKVKKDARHKNPLYKRYKGIKQRCYNPNHKQWNDWGGRNITMCDEWLNDFKVFESWALENGFSQELHLDRIDNDGNYEPSNCRWATRKEQANNKTHPVGNTGKKGIHLDKRGTFITRAHGKYIGSYKTLDEALEAQACWDTVL